MTWDQIIKASIAVIVFLVVFYIFSMGTAHAPSAIFNSQMKTRIAECSATTGPTDSDNDGMPDTCDPCVDVAQEWKMSPNDYVEKIKESEDKKWPGMINIEIGKYYDDLNADNPDNDNDGLHDACEMTRVMEWALAHPFKATVTNYVNKYEEDDLKEFTDPKDASDKMYCKYWYSEFQCCSRLGDKVKPIGKDGNEVAGKTLKCLPHDKQPS